MIGKLLNQYRIEAVVGHGGMGVVYRALDTNLGRTVAVKVLSASLREDPQFVERFRQEARIQAGLNHPNIATLFDFFVWNDMPVAVMEFIKGETLRSMVDRSGPIPAHVALPIFVQALHGVAAGHKRRIIHRDLKPSNLMITDEGIVKITDFGIAKVRSVAGHTQESTRVGSAKYMAPEQILGRQIDVQTDIYIMGGTLYELLTGRPPFEGVSQFEIDSAHVRDRPKEPTEYCPNIPPAAVDAIMRALAKEPSERFASAEEFIQALPDLHGVPYVAKDSATEDKTRLRPNQSNTVRPRHAGIAVAIAASGLLVLSIIGVVRYSERQVDIRPDHGPRSRSTLGERPGPTPQTQLSAPTNTGDTTPLNTELKAPPNTEDITSPTTQAAAQPTTQAAAQPNTQPAAQPNTQRTMQPDTQPNPAGTTPPKTAVTASLTMDPKPAGQVTRAPSPTLNSDRDLTGVWTGTYLDRSGNARLQLLNLQMQQVPDGAITGHLTYEAGGSPGEECTLDKSSYSTQSKRLRLIIHCRSPNRPKYLNVPLEFVDVDPGASSIEGGRLAFHLADDIVVTLKRTKGL